MGVGPEVGLEGGGGRTTLLFDLLEHEVLHQGQLVRYFYANGLPFPSSFAERYSLQQPAP